jgi:hypothetical protein
MRFPTRSGGKQKTVAGPGRGFGFWRMFLVSKTVTKTKAKGWISGSVFCLKPFFIPVGRPLYFWGVFLIAGWDLLFCFCA